jgi:hypothetical protein
VQERSSIDNKGEKQRGNRFFPALAALTGDQWKQVLPDHQYLVEVARTPEEERSTTMKQIGKSLINGPVYAVPTGR